jgi:dihydropteroate synthase
MKTDVMAVYYRPIPDTDPAPRPGALPLAGGWTRFAQVECLSRGRAAEIVPAVELPAATLDALTRPRPPIAGLSMDAPRLMGILNVTPDSFSDGGRHVDVAGALARAEAMMAEGADLIDIGGESTRPGAAKVPEAEEALRVVPVIAALSSRDEGVPLSLDTRKSAVARAGLEAGARIVNDVSGLRFDPGLAPVVAGGGAALILMHSIGTPETMQALAAEGAYGDVLLDVYDALEAAIAQAETGGVRREAIVVDPGIGFGKTDAENRALMSRIGLFHGLGCPILLGASRKGFVGRATGVASAEDRGPGSAGLALWAVSQGVQFLRVHDIETHRQAIAAWRTVAGPDRPVDGRED